jgi:hypothetical protein
MKETFAGRVRAAAKALQEEGRQVTLEGLEMGCGTLIQTHRDRNFLCRTVSNLCEAGEMRRKSRGVYDYLGRHRSPQKQQIMWRYLRSGRSFGGATVHDLQEVAGVCEGYVYEWLGSLAALGLVNKIKDCWQLTAGLTEMPQNEAKAERLRNIRARNQNAIR